MAVLKHIPERTCVACRRKGKKESFFRMSKSENGELTPDTADKSVGRGFYICKTDSCITQLLLKNDTKKKQSKRVFISPETATILQQQLSK